MVIFPDADGKFNFAANKKNRLSVDVPPKQVTIKVEATATTNLSDKPPAKVKVFNKKENRTMEFDIKATDYTEHNDDRHYWLNKLSEVNDIASDMGDHISVLTEASHFVDSDKEKFFTDVYLWDTTTAEKVEWPDYLSVSTELSEHEDEFVAFDAKTEDAFEMLKRIGEGLKYAYDEMPAREWDVQYDKTINEGTADYTILDGDASIFEMTPTTSDVTITLPDLAANTGRVIEIHQMGSGAGMTVIVPAGSDDIQGKTELKLDDQYNYAVLRAGIGTWHILDLQISGSNSDGHYVRYFNGVQVCMGAITDTNAVNNAWGSIYIGDAYTWTYPKAFSAEPWGFGGLCDNSTAAGWLIINTVGVTAADLYPARGSSMTSASWKYRPIVVGPWS